MHQSVCGIIFILKVIMLVRWSFRTTVDHVCFSRLLHSLTGDRQRVLLLFSVGNRQMEWDNRAIQRPLIGQCCAQCWLLAVIVYCGPLSPALCVSASGSVIHRHAGKQTRRVGLQKSSLQNSSDIHPQHNDIVSLLGFWLSSAWLCGLCMAGLETGTVYPGTRHRLTRQLTRRCKVALCVNGFLLLLLLMLLLLLFCRNRLESQYYETPYSSQGENTLCVFPSVQIFSVTDYHTMVIYEYIKSKLI